MKLDDNTLGLMKELTQLVGVSGNEIRVSKLLQEHYKKYTDKIVFDNLGSVYAVKFSGKENAPKVMISAHMDELGFIVKDITKMGLIKILPLGTPCNQGLLGQRVVLVTNGGTEYKGAIVAKKIEDKKKAIEVDNILVDIGATSKEEVESLGIRLGDSIVLEGTFEVLSNGNRIMSKAWNNRYGCILGVEVFEALKDVQLDVDLYVGCTVQHEVGLRGSQTATNLVEPDVAIVMDCLASNDTTGENDSVGKLGEGVLINYYDKSMMPNKALLNHLVSICKENNIAHQHFYSMGDGDNGWIHKLLKGCPTLTACICARNITTNSSIIDSNDYIAAKEAVINVIKSLNKENIEGFKVENR